MERAVEEHDSGRQGAFTAEGTDGCLATGHTPPVEPLEHLVSEEDIRRGERAGAKRSKDPGFFISSPSSTAASS